MSRPAPSFLRSYLPLVSAGLLVAGGVATVGLLVERATSSEVAAVVVGCAASWVASCIGAMPTALALSADPRNIAMAVMTSTAVRFVVVLMFVVPLALSGWFPRTLFVVFVAISYMLILLVESVIAVRMVRRCSASEGK